jgi:hypothetical protein
MNTAAKRPQPTSEQLAALRDFAAEWGRQWKAELRSVWETGNYSYRDQDIAPALQQVRNQFGPAWLKRFQFAKL